MPGCTSATPMDWTLPPRSWARRHATATRSFCGSRRTTVRSR
jgi:hypothetical protein